MVTSSLKLWVLVAVLVVGVIAASASITGAATDTRSGYTAPTLFIDGPADNAVFASGSQVTVFGWAADRSNTEVTAVKVFLDDVELATPRTVRNDVCNVYPEIYECGLAALNPNYHKTGYSVSTSPVDGVHTILVRATTSNSWREMTKTITIGAGSKASAPPKIWTDVPVNGKSYKNGQQIRFFGWTYDVDYLFPTTVKTFVDGVEIPVNREVRADVCSFFNNKPYECAQGTQLVGWYATWTPNDDFSGGGPNGTATKYSHTLRVRSSVPGQIANDNVGFSVIP